MHVLERGPDGRFLKPGAPGKQGNPVNPGKTESPGNPRNPEQPKTSKKLGRTKTQAEVVAEIRKKVETKLKTDAKATLGDYIRLVQLEKDLEDSELKEIRVTWVEPKKTEVED